MTTQWLSLSEYSKKYDVSISTLRRRIRQKACDFLFEEGRYELRDCPLEEHEGTKHEKVMILSAPPQNLTGSKSQRKDDHLIAVPREPLVSETISAPNVSSSIQAKTGTESFSPPKTSGILDPSILIAELKKAYSMILSEKEQQIMTLKEEVADLRTLVRVLEESNQQLKASLEEARSIDSWLSSLDK